MKTYIWQMKRIKIIPRFLVIEFNNFGSGVLANNKQEFKYRITMHQKKACSS